MAQSRLISCLTVLIIITLELGGAVVESRTLAHTRPVGTPAATEALVATEVPFYSDVSAHVVQAASNIQQNCAIQQRRLASTKIALHAAPPRRAAGSWHTDNVSAPVSGCLGFQMGPLHVSQNFMNFQGCVVHNHSAHPCVRVCIHTTPACANARHACMRAHVRT